jgi:predicted mannosyl-3-phosphoglycerate phosphatase (HAD superfamily)
LHLLRHAEPVAVVERAVAHLARRLGLEYDLSLAGFGRDRDHSVLLPADHPAAGRLGAALIAAGFNVRRGHRWISVARGGGKGEAVRRYIEARRVTGNLPDVVAAIGDSDNDRSMLAVVPHRFVINRPGDGYHPALAAIPGIRTLDAPGHLGWIEAVESLCALSVEALP